MDSMLQGQSKGLKGISKVTGGLPQAALLSTWHVGGEDASQPQNMRCGMDGLKARVAAAVTSRKTCPDCSTNKPLVVLSD
jgi:hypothetical protein